jgi:hypothetical protein
MVTNDAVNIHFMVVSKQKKDSGQAYVSLAQTASTNGGGEPTEEENQWRRRTNGGIMHAWGHMVKLWLPYLPHYCMHPFMYVYVS